jgi:uncharacterized membrane protein
MTVWQTAQVSGDDSEIPVEAGNPDPGDGQRWLTPGVTIRISGAVQVQAYGIDNRGRVVGQYVDDDGAFHGYVWEKGHVDVIDGSDSAAAAGELDINDHGQMVGVYLDAAGGFHAFARSSGGDYTTIDAPDATYTYPFGINNRGQIAGFLTEIPVLSIEGRGFVLRQGAGGPLTTVEVPGADTGTAVTDISDAGTVVGLYSNPHASDGPPPPMMQPLAHAFP